MKIVHYNAALVSSRAILSGDYFKLTSVLYFTSSVADIVVFCCFLFLLHETQERNCYVMELSKCMYVHSFVFQQLTDVNKLT